MPLTVVLRSTGDESDTNPPALTFDGARIVIGRGPGCDVRLPDPSVSHRHATLRAKDGAYLLVDEKSTNGTYVDQDRLAPDTPRPIKSGELFRVGRVWLEMRVDQAPATQDLAHATRDVALGLVSRAMRRSGEDVSVRLRVVEGPDAGDAAVLSLVDEGRVYAIGRDTTCALPLADRDVSREHVHVVRRGPLVLVRDLGSKNGLSLGDARAPAARDVAWRGGGELLRIGNTAIALEDPAALALAELEAAPDEPMGPDDVPPKPEPSGARGVAPPADPAEPAIARGPEAPKTATPPTSSSVSRADATVVLAALALLGLSLLGLYWLLHA
jgi:pSer/pThr/pTyr-binding forkhead associated (FHA) protein